MSEAAETADREPLQPRATSVLFGHAAAEAVLLNSYRSGRLAHAWLLAGTGGIGKATLAYRMARFMLAHPNRSQVPPTATSLHVPMRTPGCPSRRPRRLTGISLVLERTINEKTEKLRQEIQVDDVRRAVRFFGSTAGEGGWRVAIVDAVDELNAEGANALLKVLEEPPEKALLLLVSHAGSRVLPTMRSRCRILGLQPLATADVARAAAAAIGRDANDARGRRGSRCRGRQRTTGFGTTGS